MVDVPDYVLRKLTDTYYHDPKMDDHRFMFLLEDQGIPGEHVIIEVANYVDDPGYDPYDAVQIYRRFGSRWVAKRGNTDLTRESTPLEGIKAGISPVVVAEYIVRDRYMQLKIVWVHSSRLSPTHRDSDKGPNLT